MFKPLLASDADLATLKFPLLASPKMDGIRALVDGGKLFSRNKKPIPNKFIASHVFRPDLDGEILTYTDGVRDDFNTVQSKVMRAEGEPDFKFHVFDSFAMPALAFITRLALAEAAVLIHDCAREELTRHRIIDDLAELLVYEEHCLAAGWEGVMLRDPDGRYKFGRSTTKEGILLKLKRFADDEATIISTVERMHNTNEATKDALGRTERSSAKGGLVPMDTLGALVCEWKGVRFEVGTGFDDATRLYLWACRDTLPGTLVNFKFQGVGSQGAPRFPVYRGLRNDL